MFADMIGTWFAIILATIVGLLPIANPFSTSAVFLALTADDSDAYRREQAKWACIYMFGILLAFLIAGSLIMQFFGISISGLRIAGGIMIARVALNMFRAPAPTVNPKAKEEAVQKTDIAFTPLAMPSLSGPGAIAVTVSMATQAGHWSQYVAIAVGLLLTAVICWVVLNGATRVVRVLGHNGLSALTKIMGFLLLCVGVQFIVNGVVGIVIEEEFMASLIQAIRNASAAE